MTPREVLQRHTERVWNQGDFDAVETYIAPEYVEHNPTVEDHIEGPAAYRKNVEQFFTAFPDLWVDIEQSVVEGDLIAARKRWGGTHEGPFMGIDPTGTKVESTSMLICRIPDDQIVETYVTSDTLDVLKQLGLEVP